MIEHEINNGQIASTVSEWTKKANQMLPKEPEEIQKLLDSGMAVVVWSNCEDPKPVGFAGITYEWPGDWKELGGLSVSPELWGQGIGHMVVKKQIELAKEKFPNANLFALCNKNSLPILLSLGATIIEDSTVLPIEVFEECVKCPKFQLARSQGKMCCDTPVRIK